MKLLQYTIVLALLSIGLARTCGGDQSVSGPESALKVLDSPSPWTAGAKLGLDRRHFAAGPTSLDVDLVHLLGYVGLDLFPFLYVAGEAGYVDASRTGYGGSGDFEWGGLATADVVEHIIRESPVSHAKECVRLGVTAHYSNMRSDFTDRRFEWWQLRVIPALTYEYRKGDKVLWYAYEPQALAVHGGVVFATVHGDYGRASLSDNHPFGVGLGLDALTTGGWVASFSGNFYGNGGQELAFGIRYDF